METRSGSGGVETNAEAAGRVGVVAMGRAAQRAQQRTCSSREGRMKRRGDGGDGRGANDKAKGKGNQWNEKKRQILSLRCDTQKYHDDNKINQIMIKISNMLVWSNERTSDNGQTKRRHGDRGQRPSGRGKAQQKPRLYSSLLSTAEGAAASSTAGDAHRSGLQTTEAPPRHFCGRSSTP